MDNNKRDIKEIKEIIKCVKNEGIDLIGYLIKISVFGFLFIIAIGLFLYAIFGVVL